MESDTCAGAGEVSELKSETDPWNNLVAEFSDVFELPGMPTDCNTVYRIELEPGAMPPFRHQYQVSAAELAEVHR